jgi:hypothetical protein
LATLTSRTEGLSTGLDDENPLSHIFCGSLHLRRSFLNRLKSFKELEVKMSDRTFESPVFVRVAEGLVQEIACLEDAFDFLDEWPRHRRGVIYDTAKRACQRAFDGYIPSTVARDAFAGFARSAKILEEVSTTVPWMVGVKSDQTGGVAA